MKNDQFGYLIYHVNPDPRVATIEQLNDDFIWDEELTDGTPVSTQFTKTTQLSLYEDSGDMICDFITNTKRLLIISEKARDTLIDAGITHELVEFLPFVLKDKMGKRLKNQYYIANPLLKINCIDMDKSDCKAYPTSGKIFRIYSLVVKPEKVPEDAILFRLGELPHHIIIRSDLADKLQKETTGLYVAKMGDKIY